VNDVHLCDVRLCDYHQKNDQMNDCLLYVLLYVLLFLFLQSLRLKVQE
jgi:hypothetical protein